MRWQTVQEVRSLTSNGAKFVDGEEMAFDSVVFATGYKTNVPFWLKAISSFHFHDIKIVFLFYPFISCDL